MKTIFYIILVCCIFQSCNEEKTGKNQDSTITNHDSVHIKLDHDVIHTQETDTSITVKVKDSIPTHIFKTGETLWILGKKFYGNRHYSSILARYNGIKDVNRIKNGSFIKVPNLHYMLTDSTFGLNPIAHHEIENILEARSLFMKHEKSLYTLRDSVKSITRLILPEHIKADILSSVSLIDESIVSLNLLKSDTTQVPKKMISQLRSVSANLKSLSTGKHDGDYGYDLDMVHQNLIRAINNAISWAKNGYE